jgi:soluble lytic murein transglycosylase-like protein
MMALTRPGVLRLTALLALAAGVAHADIYQHVDSNGVIVFQNKKKHGKLVARERPSRVVMPSAGGETSRYDAHIREAAALYQIPEALIRAVIKIESNFDPRALSPANAHGLMQLIPETAARMMVTDIYDPRQNIMGGVRYLRVLANLFNGNLELTLAGYNAGENAVMKYGGIPPYKETQHYVVKVLSAYAQYRRIAQPG